MFHMRVLIAAIVVLGLFVVRPTAVWARDTQSMGPDDITALQQRLTDAGCYRGTADGVASPALDAAIKACPSQQPTLRIETGMHTAAIWRIGFDAACRIAATVSDDKTVRLWSMPDGRPLYTQRLPIGVTGDGSLYAVAVSPDGALVAAAGWDAHYSIDGKHSVYVFDAASGQNVRRLGVLNAVIHRLAFSPDGSQIAVSLYAGGVRTLDVASGREIMADTDYSDQSNGVAYGPDGSLYAAAYDGFVRHYGPDGVRKQKIAAQGGKQINSIAVDPTGRRVAIGFTDTNVVALFDAQTLGPLGFADTRDISNGDLLSVAWSADGRRLYAGGTAQKIVNGTWYRFVRSFDASGRRVELDSPVSFDTITDVARCGDRIAFTARDPSFGVLRPHQNALILEKGHTVDMRAKTGTGFTVSQDGAEVRLGLDYADGSPVLADIGTGQVIDAPDPVAGLAVPDITRLPVSDWAYSEKPKLGGTLLELYAYERALALAIRSDGTGLVMGADFTLRSYDSAGKLRWTMPSPSAVWGVNFARNGDLIVAAHDDGTIRWHRWSDGQELLALFIDKDDKRFVAWTPTGYYMASPGAEDLIGWHINRGWEQTADFFPASRFRDRFNRPDIVRRVLQTLDEDAAIHEADAAIHQREETRSIITKLPPVLRILSPATQSRFSTDDVSIHYAVRSPSNLPVDRIDVLIDGVRQQDRGFNRIEQPGSGESQGNLTVHLPQRDVEVALVVHAGDLSAEPAKIRLSYEGAVARGDDLLKPKLYALVAGISDYVDPGLKLGYASKDAKDFAAALQAQAGGLYGNVEVRVIVDRDATRPNLLHGLKWLEKQVTSRDVGIVFLAGHGVNDAQQGYWFLPADATPEDLEVSALSQEDIKRTLNGLAGKALLFLDSCHAGQIGAEGTKRRGTLDINKVVGDFAAADNGVVVFASSTGREVSEESQAWGNGAFTKALIEGITQGKADLLHRNTITLSELDAFVTDRVKELTNGEQHPVMTKPTTVPDYPIALARK